MLFEILIYTTTLSTISILSKLIYDDIVNNNIDNLRQIELMPFNSYSRVIY